MLTVLLVAALSLPVLAEKRLTASEAKNHIGEEATVCGKAASARYAASSRGQPTFLNLDKPYPNPVFTVKISAVPRLQSPLHRTQRGGHSSPVFRPGLLSLLRQGL